MKPVELIHTATGSTVRANPQQAKSLLQKGWKKAPNPQQASGPKAKSNNQQTGGE